MQLPTRERAPRAPARPRAATLTLAWAFSALVAPTLGCSTAGEGAPPPPGLGEGAAAADPSAHGAAPGSRPAQPPATLSASARGAASASRLRPAASGVSAASAPAAAPAATAPTGAPALPEHLSATGLYEPGGTQRLHPEVIQFAPQYPLWTDGATKRRFLWLPPGTTIDASEPDAWVFPPGTRFWKEFAFPAAARDAGVAAGVRRVETRYIERRLDGSWVFASYVWDAAGSDARLAAVGGQARVAPIGTTGQWHDVPSRGDCSICHEGAGERAPILGFTALQLSPERDPLAPHAEPLPEGALDLEQLSERGLVVGYPSGTTEGPARPSIVAESPEARASLGYLHANCSGCHNRHGPLADLELDFEQTVAEPGSTERVLNSLLQVPSRYRLPGAEHSERFVPGDPAASVLAVRLGSRSIAQQMPPLGSKVVDQEGLLLITSWIHGSSSPAPSGARKETP